MIFDLQDLMPYGKEGEIMSVSEHLGRREKLHCSFVGSEVYHKIIVITSLFLLIFL